MPKYDAMMLSFGSSYKRKEQQRKRDELDRLEHTAKLHTELWLEWQWQSRGRYLHPPQAQRTNPNQGQRETYTDLKNQMDRELNEHVQRHGGWDKVAPEQLALMNKVRTIFEQYGDDSGFV